MELINNQPSLNSKVGTFGKYGSIAGNGCGAIAVTNVCRLNGQNVGLSEVINYLVNNHGILAGGALGTTDKGLKNALLKFGLESKKIGKWKRLSQTEGYRYFIIQFFWRQGFRIGGHYQAGHITEDGKIEIFNYHRVYDSIDEMKVKEQMMFAPTIYGVY